ncbi:signal peptide-containing protein [Cryptosporidium canis]|uniref:Signal peptide-containing protein n=1 Tax=Cryptosporidium canis TaxID=195482 RepID=A0A9D5HYM1_9CRYT|nr:signal peptide-containing protein [Cryptosporidium canis]
MGAKHRPLAYLIFIAIIKSLIFELHVATCTDLHAHASTNAKVVLRFPPYTGLEEESLEIKGEKSLGEYVLVGERRLENLVGGELGSEVDIVVNEVGVERSEFGHLISDFKVAENEDVVVEFRLREGLASRFGGGMGGQEGVLILGFSCVNGDSVGGSRLPRAVSVRERLPMVFRDLRGLLEGFAGPGEFVIESITTLRNPERELVGSGEEEEVDLESGDLVRVRVRDLGPGARLGEGGAGSDGDGAPGVGRDLSVMVMFSNRGEVPSKRIALGRDSTVGDLLEELHKITFPGTDRRVISGGDRFAIQNEQGREVEQVEEARLGDFIPEGVDASEGRPLVLYVTIFSVAEERLDQQDEAGGMRQEVSKIFEPKDIKEIDEFILNVNNEVREIDSDLEAIQDGRRGADAPALRLVGQEGRVEYEVKGDSSLVTTASLYSLAQFVWYSSGQTESGCLLSYEGRHGGERVVIDPNSHEAIGTLPGYYRGVRVGMRGLKSLGIEILVYLSVKNESEQVEDKILFTKSLEVSEIISVTSFLRLVNSNYGGELSKYTVVGIQKDAGDGRLVEYLPVPRTPSSTTYLTFCSEKQDLGIFLEVVPARSIEIMLLIPSSVTGEEISERSAEDTDSGEESMLEYRLKILSNMTVRELIQSLIESGVLDRSVSASTVYVRDKSSETYLGREFVIGQQSSKEGVGRKKMQGRMIFAVEIVKRLSLSALFYNSQGEELEMQPLQVSVGASQSVLELKREIVSKAKQQGVSLDEQRMGIGSGLDIGEEFKKVVYTILKDSDRVDESGLAPNDELRVYLLQEEREEPARREGQDQESGGEAGPGGLGGGRGPRLEIPLSIENCPLNTMLERRWFIVPMDLGTPIGDLKETIDGVAMLNGMDFDLFAETEKGRLELSQDAESCSSLGVTEVGVLTAVCNGRRNDRTRGGVGSNRSVSQAIVDDICEDGGESSEQCSRPTGKEGPGRSPSDKRDEIDVIFDEGSAEETGERDRESLELLEKIEMKIEEMEQRELRSRRNRKMLSKLVKAEAASSSRTELKQKELVKLLREFLTTYVSKGTAGLRRFCKRQGPERIEQLVLYISTEDGKRMSRKVAKRILDRMRRRGRRTRVRSDRNVMLDIEYSILPSIAQYSEYEDGSVSSDYSTSESTDFSHSEDEGTEALRQASTGRRGRSSAGKTEAHGGSSLNGDLDPVTRVKRSRRKNKVIRALKKVPIVSPAISFLYSRLSSRGRKKRRAKKYIKEIRELEIQFRKRAYGYFQDPRDPNLESGYQDEDQLTNLMSF